MNISLILINDNSEEYCIPLFENLSKLINIEHSEVIFIDNASTDQSVAIAREYGVSQVYRFDQRTEHRGRLYNKGLELSSNHFVMFAHTDILFSDDFFVNLSKSLEENQEADFVAFPQIYPDQNLFGFNVLAIKYESQELFSLQPRTEIPQGYQSYLQCSESCFMVHRDVFEYFHFDENYKNSFFEYDLLKKILLNGGNSVAFPDCTLTHYFIELHEKHLTHEFDQKLFRMKNIEMFNLNNAKVTDETTEKQWVNLGCEIIKKLVSKSDIVLNTHYEEDTTSSLLADTSKIVYSINVSERNTNEDYIHGNIIYSNKSLKKQKLPNDFYDFTIGLDVVDHMVDLDEYYSQLRNVTRNQGKVIIGVNKAYVSGQMSYQELKKTLQQYFIVEKIVGADQNDPSVVQIVDDKNYMNFNVFIAICRNNKYIIEDYSDVYYRNVNNGYLMNPVGKIYTADLVSQIAGPKVLSIGCGSGILEKKILEAIPTLEIHGTDINSTPFLDKLREENGLSNFHLIKNPIAYRQPFEDNTFDTVYTSHVIEHVPEPDQLIMESLRLAKHRALHLTPINLDNPDHIHFFKYMDIDNEYRTQEADIDLKEMCDGIVKEVRSLYPNISYEVRIVNPRDGSVDYGDIDFHVKRPDRPDGLMPCFLIVFSKNAH